MTESLFITTSVKEPWSMSGKKLPRSLTTPTNRFAWTNIMPKKEISSGLGRILAESGTRRACTSLVPGQSCNTEVAQSSVRIRPLLSTLFSATTALATSLLLKR
ncbi:hypothetical protein HGRIS_002348 [Hohenbuehelia grisea]|uniref:Uncharacterized protein n=1 Tax=Hohenbuehelia grisea TaxID=104357 RepID=A0ABR3JK81_9AGAR